jgi:hypothetical protein
MCNRISKDSPRLAPKGTHTKDLTSQVDTARNPWVILPQTNDAKRCQLVPFIDPPLSVSGVDGAIRSSSWRFKGDCKLNDNHHHDDKTEKKELKEGKQKTDMAVGQESKELNHSGHSHPIKTKRVQSASLLCTWSVGPYIIPETVLWMNPFHRLMFHLARQLRVTDVTWQLLVDICLVITLIVSYNTTLCAFAVVVTLHIYSHCLCSLGFLLYPYIM